MLLGTEPKVCAYETNILVLSWAVSLALKSLPLKAQSLIQLERILLEVAAASPPSLLRIWAAEALLNVLLYCNPFVSSCFQLSFSSFIYPIASHKNKQQLTLVTEENTLLKRLLKYLNRTPLIITKVGINDIHPYILKIT